MDKIFGRHHGVGQMYVLNILLEVCQQGLDKGRFPRSHLPGEKNKALSLHNAIGEQSQGLLMIFAQVEKSRRGSKVKGFFFQVIKFGVHDFPSRDESRSHNLSHIVAY